MGMEIELTKLKYFGGYATGLNALPKETGNKA
jgi:hypothetical protein